MDSEKVDSIINTDLNDFLEEYSEVFCATKFEDDINLYLNLHY